MLGSTWSCELAHNRESQFIYSSRVNKAAQKPTEIVLDDAHRPYDQLGPKFMHTLTSTYHMECLTSLSC